MDIREKLVELFYERNSHFVVFCDTCFKDTPEEFNSKLHGLADHLIANGVTVQEWIPVSERLPNKDEYIAKTKDGEEYYTRLLIAYKTDIIEYEIGYYDGYKWMTEMPIRIIKDVVAWMPFPNMPQPPKE